MTDDVVELVEAWQSGFFVVLGCAAVGLTTAVAARGVLGWPWSMLGFLGGGVAGFVAYSYLRYGR